jgi:hypothetical protein
MPRQRGSTLRIPRLPIIEQRHSVVLTPRLVFWDWVNDANHYDLVVRPNGTECNVYLISDKLEPERWVERHWLRLFEHELTTWNRNLAAWPERTRATFDAWFNVHTCLAVMDAGTQGLRRVTFPAVVVGPREVRHAVRRRPVIDEA